MENTIQICCITVDFEPLPAADELQKERNLLGPLRKMRNYKGKSVGDIFVRTHFLKNLRAFKF